jgi:hypothetical protein
MILAWGAGCLSIAAVFFTASPPPTLLYAGFLLSALAGLAAGVLAVRGVTYWRRLALAAGLAHVALADYAWSTVPGDRLDAIRAYLEHQPKVVFDGVVLPLLAAVFGVVAAVHWIRQPE